MSDNSNKRLNISNNEMNSSSNGDNPNNENIIYLNMSNLLSLMR
ncbi:MAG: hypothetical protein R3A12_06475 [Ignavibacteria bacterium]